MTICYLADFRSPIARNWIAYFAAGHRLHVLSTHPAAPMAGVELHVLGRTVADERGRRKATLAGWVDPAGWTGRAAGWVQDHGVLPAQALRRAPAVRRLLARLAPDLVHSLRIPSEGELGGLAGARPHLISAWGNDFTLFASRGWMHAWLTRRALEGCAGFLADAHADVVRARRYGLPAGVPALVVPGAGGVDAKIFFPDSSRARTEWGGELRPLANLPPGARLVVNARGFRRYVRNDTFFAAAQRLAAARRDVFFVGVGLRGWSPVERMVERLGIGPRVLLTGGLRQDELAQLHQQPGVMVSPTEHDGTPNTLLEAMACGAVPVCGDLPSLREWIDDGVNGLLVPAGCPEQLAKAIGRALDDGALAARARQRNPVIVAERGEYESSMALAAAFYEKVSRPERVLVTAGLDIQAREVRL